MQSFGGFADKRCTYHFLDSEIATTVKLHEPGSVASLDNGSVMFAGIGRTGAGVPLLSLLSAGGPLAALGACKIDRTLKEDPQKPGTFSYEETLTGCSGHVFQGRSGEGTFSCS